MNKAKADTKAQPKATPKADTQKVVPERFAKKKQRDETLAKAKSDRHASHKQTRAALRTQIFQSAEKYHKDYVQHRKTILENKRSVRARSKGNFYVEPEAKIALVVRIRGINKLNPQVRSILKLLRLRQLHNASFVRLNTATINMLRRVEPYIAYGYPTRETISKLVYKRGYVKINRQRIPITDNSVVQHGLGEFKISAIEDLVNEIYTCGPNFKQANNYLWPFKLTSPKDGFEEKRHPYQKGGAWGNREDKINELIGRML